jgi:predicted transglutaminase-like cysteine proteinase
MEPVRAYDHASRFMRPLTGWKPRPMSFLLRSAFCIGLVFWLAAGQREAETVAHVAAGAGQAAAGALAAACLREPERCRRATGLATAAR